MNPSKITLLIVFTLRKLTLAALLALVAGWPHAAEAQDAQRPPNVVLLFADDLGYGDLGAYGHPTIRTPHLDRMAAEGMKLTQFYSAASVCTPSRAALLTGRLPVRSGMASNEYGVLFPDSRGGLPQREVTLAEALKEQGYATAAVGKWHLGHHPEHLPTNHGFDAYFGVPYSNDMSKTADAPTDAPEGKKGVYAPIFQEPKNAYFDVPLLRDTTVIERPAQQQTLTKRYTEEAVAFVEAHEEQPFFLYLAYTFPHVPLFRSEAFEGVSRRGLYGDVVEEIDWSVGQVLEALRAAGLAENTLVVFTSDNGPWASFDAQGGSAGLLRGAKGTTWEGGMRVPALAWWPSRIRAGRVAPELATTMDLYTTALTLAGADVPTDRVVDGVDLTPLLDGEGGSARETVFYYRGEDLHAVRSGPYKAHFATQAGFGGEVQSHETPLLFHLEHDPPEQYDVAADHPEVIAEIREVVQRHQASLERAKDRLAERGPQYIRE